MGKAKKNISLHTLPLYIVICLFLLIITLPDEASMLHIHPVLSSKAKSILTDIANSHADSEEVRFQEYLDSLFDTKGEVIDTNGWCTNRINCNRFDYQVLKDTVHIPIIDPSLGRYFSYPLRNYVTSRFGPRRSYWHFGTDIKVFYRDTIRCVFDGIVRVVTNDRYGYGKVAVVRHHYGIETLYGHMSKVMVKNNQVLKSGDVIGLGGRTGRATGNHLHFEIRFCGEPFDPACLLDYKRFSNKSDTLHISRATFSYIDSLRKKVYHTVIKGETLKSISRRYKTSVHALCRLNGISKKTILHVGRRLIVRVYSRRRRSKQVLENTRNTKSKS